MGAIIIKDLFMYCFILGREYKLSIAEILSVFSSGEIIGYNSEVILIDDIKDEEINSKINSLGGTIKIAKVFDTSIIKDAKKSSGKFTYGINVYGKKGILKKLLSDTKKDLKDSGVSSRFVNKDFTNLNTAQILGENLIKKQSDYNYIYIDGKQVCAKTVWVQDINAYSKRDYAKTRDMQIGMLPPKLAQMMINIAGHGKNILDPFVGLGTVLIEASLLGYTNLYGSDLNEKMVEFSEKNLKLFTKDNKISISNTGFEKLNAKFIHESNFIDKNIDIIVSEGYLGEVMTQKNISLDRINKQKDSLKQLYEMFFSNILKSKFNGIIVISFPFWDLNGKYVYLNEVYEILEEYCDIELFFPIGFENLASKSGSLLYKREKQLVGREIFKLKIKR